MASLLHFLILVRHALVILLLLLLLLIVTERRVGHAIGVTRDLHVLDIVYALLVAVGPYAPRTILPLHGRSVLTLAPVPLPRPVHTFPAVHHLRAVSVVVIQVG